VATEWGSPQARRQGWLRASDADREQAVDVLKTAFIEGLITREELAERVGQALTARTHADVATVIAGIPIEVGAERPSATVPVTPRHKSGPRAKAGACLAVATVIMLAEGASTIHAGSTASMLYVLSIMTFVVTFVVWLWTLAAG
jgi:hypothetical protein